eukprot:4608877-Pyramimonas_sp.AAC.1
MPARARRAKLGPTVLDGHIRGVCVLASIAQTRLQHEDSLANHTWHQGQGTRVRTNGEQALVPKLTRESDADVPGLHRGT